MSTDKKDNSFNFIRILAAINVFWGHACEHLDIDQPILLNELWIAFRGVPIFFILSGFLIWNSLEKQQSFKQYLSKRVIRLYPELWSGVLLNAVIMIIVYRGIKIVPFIIFTITQSTFFQFWTPACLRDYGCGTPNGSLWTIGVMVQCYIILFFIHKFLHGKKPLIFGTVTVILSIGNFFPPLALSELFPEFIYKLCRQTFIPYIWLFVFGAMMCEYFDKIIFGLKRFKFPLLAALLVVSISRIDGNIGAVYEPVKSILLGLNIIGFGYSLNIKIKHDFSYGFYIYHMVVINLLVEFNFVGNIIYLLIAFVVSAILSAVSFYTSGQLSRNLKNVVAGK